MGQRVGNCESFASTHYLTNVLAMHCGPRAKPLCVQHCIQLTSLLFQVNRPPHSKVKCLSHNLGPTSYRLTSFWFHANPPLTPMIELFLNLNFKIQGHSHSSRSHSRCNILSTHISRSFHVDRPFRSRDTAISKIDLEIPRSRSKFKVTM